VRACENSHSRWKRVARVHIVDLHAVGSWSNYSTGGHCEGLVVYRPDMKADGAPHGQTLDGMVERAAEASCALGAMAPRKRDHRRRARTSGSAVELESMNATAAASCWQAAERGMWPTWTYPGLHG
jgi:hypothetical protein